MFAEINHSSPFCCSHPSLNRADPELRKGETAEGDFRLLQKCPVWVSLQALRHGLGPNAQVEKGQK